MSSNRVAVVGTGQTKYASTRGDVSLPGLLREAVYRALEDAHMTMADIDAAWDALAQSTYPKVRGGVVPAELFDEVQKLLKEFRARK